MKNSKLSAVISDDLAACGKRGASLPRAINAYLFDPPMKVVINHRFARWATDQGAVGKLIAKILWNKNCSYGCYISLRSEIGSGLHLPHPTGIVIGDGVVIGENVTIYQNVTIGRRQKSEVGYPKIEEGATIYAGASIIGDINIGMGAVIASNSVVLSSVDPRQVVGGIPAKLLSDPTPEIEIKA